MPTHDLNLLVPLRALLEELSVTRAAERAGMRQSTMSSALARLREEFSDELLVRIGRDYELTPFARQLLAQVQIVLPLMEHALADDVDSDPSTASRTIGVMCTDYAAVCLNPAIAAVLEAAPGMDVDILALPERPTESVRDLFIHDFVVAPAGIGIQGRSADLWTDDYVCLVDRDNPAVSDGCLSFDDFLSLPQAVVQFGKNSHSAADRRLQELGVSRPDPRVTSASLLPLPAMVAGTDLVAVVPRRLAEHLGPGSGTIGVDPPFGRAEIVIKLWWHEAHDSDPLHSWFRESLIETCSGPGGHH